jgi:hypothetical protein
MDPAGYSLGGLQVQRSWNTYAVFVCGRMSTACITFFSICRELQWKERKAVESNNHTAYAGHGKSRKDINLSVAILQVFKLLFQRLWKNQGDPEKIPHARGSNILHPVSRRTLILVASKSSAGYMNDTKISYM